MIPKSFKSLRAHHLFALSLIAIVNLREYPVLATMGWRVVGYTGIAFFGFLLPSAWICSQLAVLMPSQGGLYVWFREAFGTSWARLGMSVEWLNNMISFPASCTVIIATILTGFWPTWNPPLSLTIILTLALYWVCIVICCCGLTLTHRMSSWSALIGILVPTALIIVLGIAWFLTGHPMAWKTSVVMKPHLVGNIEWGVLVSVFSAYAGMQASAFFAPQVDSPARAYPLALVTCAVVIVVMTTGAALAMSAVIPQASLNYVNGVIACFQQYLAAFHLSQYLGILVLMMVFGAFSALCTWSQALSRGVYQMALEGQWPAYFSKINDRQIPVRVLMLQGGVVSTLILSLLCVPDAQTGFWLMILLTSQLSVVLYIGLFVCGMRLLLPYQSLWQQGITLVASLLGVCSSCMGLVASFCKPSHVVWSQSVYMEVVVFCDGVFILLCAVWYFKRQSFKLATDRQSP
tara:strand:- start:16388 stop:17773 length:1386 start_codon:yes stop_codon:yes gene_type:complete